MVGLGLLAGGAYVLWRILDTDRRAEVPGPSPQPRAPHSPPRPAATAEAPAWVEPKAQACPASHPVKAKLASGIYHEPSGASYDRTVPDRCYRDGPAAQLDGLRPAKR